MKLTAFTAVETRFGFTARSASFAVWGLANREREPRLTAGRLSREGLGRIPLETRKRDMTQARQMMATAAAIALTFGISGKTLDPIEQDEPISTGDILIVTNDSAAEEASLTAKIDQPDRGNPITGNSSE